MRKRLNPELTKMLQTWATHENRNTGLEYPPITTIGKFLHSPGRSSRRGIGPHYEPDPIAKRVNSALDEICCKDRALLDCKYREGMSDRIIALICGLTKNQISWRMEVAHRNVAKALKIPVYR